MILIYATDRLDAVQAVVGLSRLDRSIRFPVALGSVVLGEVTFSLKRSYGILIDNRL